MQQCNGILPDFHHGFLVRTSFFRLEGSRLSTAYAGDFASCMLFVKWYSQLSSHLLYSMFFSCCVGEASNPGPVSEQQIKIAIANPTAVHQKVGKIMQLEANVVALSETSATHAVQNQVDHDLKGYGFRAFWSSHVSSKKFSADNRPSLRGEALGAAIFTHLPSRKPRSGFSDLLWETQRIAMAIIRLGGREVLFVSIYGFANRYREGKRPNDLMLASLIPAITEIGLPFCILGDFNEPPTKLNSFQFFRDMGACEAFSWYQSRFGTTLPATCSGSTGNDTAILHPWLLQYVESMEVSSEIVFEPHSPLCITLKFDDMARSQVTWNLPKTWASIAPDGGLIAGEYRSVDFDVLHEQFHGKPEELTDAAFLQWSRETEGAVDRALCKARCRDPTRHVVPSLHSSFKGRCSFQKKNVEKNRIG